jgi:hypothetical protein
MPSPTSLGLENTPLPRNGEGRITDVDVTLSLSTFNAKRIEVAAGYATSTALARWNFG